MRTSTHAPAAGSTVALWLPVSHEAAVEDDAQNPAPPQATNARGTALVVDDEVLVRMCTADMLEDLAYEVVEAASGEEALRLVDEGLVPDVLITDHLMPGINGETLAHKLRERWPELPVLIVSGYAQSDGVAVGLPRLTKPFRHAELVERLASVHPE